MIIAIGNIIGSGSSTSSDTTNDILLEDGSFILLEDGSKILLE